MICSIATRYTKQLFHLLFIMGLADLSFDFSQWIVCCATPPIQLHSTARILVNLSLHNRMSELEVGFSTYLSTWSTMNATVYYLGNAACASQGHQFAPPVICNLKDCHMSHISTFQCHCFHLPLLLAHLWSNHLVQDILEFLRSFVPHSTETYLSFTPTMGFTLISEKDEWDPLVAARSSGRSILPLLLEHPKRTSTE